MNYANALAQAIAAAREAGELLRRELHRPDGPRGQDLFCPADGEAEAIIRQRLHQAFPDFGIIGEELPAQNLPSREVGAHVWLIDPNDGTAPFIKGYRGSSVSIGLLANGVPILGVVYAFAYPDDGGDLIAWAEGCGPITRNDIPIIRPPWMENLSPTSTLLFNQSSSKHAEIYAQIAAPARFRSVPSIAYRLAMAAVGDGEITISLHRPLAWDIAAGHALLRGAGGDLFTAEGQPVAYNPDGTCARYDVFGGAPAIAPVVARRSWDRAKNAPSPEPGPYALQLPVRGALISDTALLRRAHGCWLGQLAGDNLGAQVEFQTARQIAEGPGKTLGLLMDGGIWKIIAGQPTDDSELALMLARTLAQSSHFDQEAIARSYVWWYQSPAFDIGHTTRQALSAGVSALALNKSVAEASHQAANRQSQANGALMRLSPLGIWGHALPPEELAKLARLDAMLTHPHPVCQDASAIFAVTLAYAITSGDSPARVYEHGLKWANDHHYDPAIIRALQAARHELPRDFSEQSGWVLLALQNAFYQLLHASTLEQGIVDTILQGGDTDTNACIAGALLGAIHGRQAIPAQWLNRILTCRPIAGLPGVQQPRPRAFWPVDAFLLTERLLWAGRQLAKTR